MTAYQVLYWRDIPAQVRVFAGRRPLSRQLPPRFQEEIDKAAMRDGLAGTDDYLAEWRWTEKRQREGEPEALLDALVEELVAEYDGRTGTGSQGASARVAPCPPQARRGAPG